MDAPRLDKSMRLIYGDEAFRRADEEEDARFYARDRLIAHLDAQALATVERVIDALVVEERPAILDLMASWDSHLPEHSEPARLVGLGLNPRELKANQRLSERVLHDLNRDPVLPFEDASFDVVLDTVSVDYLVKPFEVFAQVARVLRPGGLHLVLFSNRMFPEKAVEVWRRASEEERIWIVQDYFRAIPAFGKTETFVCRGRRRPADDRHSDVLAWSDPVFAVWAEKSGGDPARAPRPAPSLETSAPRREEIEQRTARVQQTLRCPYCDEAFTRWEVPDNPFCEWPNEFVYVCFNNECSYFVEGFEVMGRQGNVGFSYRLMYDPDRNTFGPLAVPNPFAVRRSMLMHRG